MSNEFYLTLQKSNLTNGFQEIYTDNELKYYTDTNTLSTGSIVGNFLGSSTLGTNINKTGANNQLLFQSNRNTTSLLPNANSSGQYLTYNGNNNNPSWVSSIPFPEFRYFFTIFGNPIDGSEIINSNRVLDSDMYYENLTVNARLDTKGFKLFVNGTLTLNGSITVTFSNNSSLGFITHLSNTRNSDNSLDKGFFYGGNGGRITDKSFNQTLGGISTVVNNIEKLSLFPNFINMRIDDKFITAGAAGGDGEPSAKGIPGGRGGVGGGILFICARQINIGSFGFMEAKGYNGGPASINSNDQNDYSAPGGGGGGGLIIIITRSIIKNGVEVDENVRGIFDVKEGFPGFWNYIKFPYDAEQGAPGLVKIIKV
jgi:hypothetical protein